ncbi:ribosome silencing factor [Photobacterium sp. WH77]|uniref:Ribosomal silencing factor RsfS n=1 Tax=Photobacterium arenosum TaxID=2774143 RepID=A0ABR9BHM0_9GAMM|nr:MULTISPECIES: ribosome silencing factor [Photobacterium]MBD8511718.1 ribosome silencing factor [Photobacterium arenosum]MBV7261578.1 ribosome silencing factor [Photobacterium sp. WH24]MCG2836792.1 ribosome silencing factor [Photobacterium sp. WH77]MCG2844599.1 ribosome silencing factor [Photobacterium sp. WH80]MDO6583569.1 ribosome silencing factor [Photobacterium sp. 2_MG-2023]
MQLQELHDFVIDKIDDMKALDIVTLDVRGKSSITDLMVVCTGTSNRHVASIADNVNTASKLIDFPPFGISGEEDAEWVVVDMGSVMLHIMQEDARQLYQLEKLWG